MRRVWNKRMLSRIALACATLSPAIVGAQSQPSGATQAPAQGSAPTCDAPEYRQFDFWVGEWDVEVKGAPTGRPKPQSSIQRILKGCVIFENWMPPNGQDGKSFNVYNRQTKKWEQTWVDSSGGVIHFTGEARDGNMYYTTEYLDAKGQKVQGKMAYFPQGPDRVRQLWEQSSDGGKTWTVAFDGIYIRKK